MIGLYVDKALKVECVHTLVTFNEDLAAQVSAELAATNSGPKNWHKIFECDMCKYRNQCCYCSDWCWKYCAKMPSGCLPLTFRVCEC
jgi:hypothetical protein